MNPLKNDLDDPLQTLVFVFGITLTLWFLIGSPGADTRLGLSVALVWFGIGASLVLFRQSRN